MDGILTLIFNEAALNNLLQSPDGPVGIKLGFVADTITANYELAVSRVWENQPAMAKPTVGYEIISGDFGLQAQIGISDNGRIAQYMASKFERASEDWVVPTIMAGWDAQL